MVYLSTNQNNIAVSSNVTIAFDQERFDQGNDFASNTFTAPVTGKYQINLMLRLNSVDTGVSYYQVKIKTSQAIEGIGNSKKLAEQDAATSLIKKLKLI